MKTVYGVRTLPVIDAVGAVAGWVRADMLADGTNPSDVIILTDGSGYGQAEAMERINADRSLMYQTREAAVANGLGRLRRGSRGRTVR